jgi:hypothetical protein
MPRAVGIGLAVALVVSLGVTGWLIRENGRLGEELAAARTQAPAAGPKAPVSEAREGRGDSVMATLGRVIDRAEPEPAAPAADAGPKDWEARRARRQDRIRDLLGRREGESEQSYRDRVAPLLAAALAWPRDRAAERRKELEEAAGISDEQSKKMDAVFADAYSEVVSAANESIAKGEISPYRRSTRGILSFVGGTVAVVDSVEARLQQILSAEQLAAADAMGFDLVEYLAVTAPWETLNPPPAE